MWLVDVEHDFDILESHVKKNKNYCELNNLWITHPLLTQVEVLIGHYRAGFGDWMS